MRKAGGGRRRAKSGKTHKKKKNEEEAESEEERSEEESEEEEESENDQNSDEENEEDDEDRSLHSRRRNPNKFIENRQGRLKFKHAASLEEIHYIVHAPPAYHYSLDGFADETVEETWYATPSPAYSA